MKNQILDTPFQNSFSDFLKKGETILWEGKPIFVQLADEGNPLRGKSGYQDFAFFFMVTIFTLFIFIEIKSFVIGIIFFFLMILGYILFMWYRKKKHNNIGYAITQRQILFQFQKRKKTEFHSIPFEAIKNIHIIKTYDFERMAKDNIDQGYSTIRYEDQDQLEKMGTIFIIPHQPELIPFETKDISNNQKRHQPTMELLEDVEAVAQLIKDGIKNVNTLL